MKNAAYLNNLLSSIDNIIFDLGGVIANINYMKTQEAFEALGLDCFGEVYSQAAQTGLFDLYEKGLIDTVTFRDSLRQHVSHLSLKDGDIDDAWNAMILDTPPYRLDILTRLKSQFRTFLLSNTNELHITYLHNQLKTIFGKENLANYFEQVYYSYEIHLRKPDKEIFSYILQKSNLNPERTLFIDDTIRHIESAKYLGIQALHIGADFTLDTLYAALSEYGKA